MNENDSNYDDLTVIDGIGRALQTWLREELGVRTYEDLFNWKVDDIKARLLASAELEDNKRRKSFMEKAANTDEYNINTWPGEAENLAAQSEKEADAAETVAEPSGSDTGDQPDSPKKVGGWEQYAIFVVSFEKRTVNGEQEKQIKIMQNEPEPEAGLKKVYTLLPEADFRWMLKQAGEELAPKKSELVTEEPKESEEDISVGEEKKAEVRVTRIQLFQPPNAKKPLATNNGRPAQKQIKADKPFALEVFFSLAGEGAESTVEQKATYIVRAVAESVVKEKAAKITRAIAESIVQRKATSSSRAVAESIEQQKAAYTAVGTDLGISDPKALVKGKLDDYNIKIPEATLESGEYRLWVMVRVQAPNAVPNFLEGPLVKVV